MTFAILWLWLSPIHLVVKWPVFTAFNYKVMINNQFRLPVFLRMPSSGLDGSQPCVVGSSWQSFLFKEGLPDQGIPYTWSQTGQFLPLLQNKLWLINSLASMQTEEVMVSDGSWLRECIKLADPLSRHIERHQTALSTLENLSRFLPQWQHVFVPLPTLIYNM